MAFDYAPSVAFAQRMIAKYGRPVTFVRYKDTLGDAAKPLHGPAAPIVAERVDNVIATFVEPSSLQSLGINTTRAPGIWGNTTQIALVAADGATDFTQFHAVLDPDDETPAFACTRFHDELLSATSGGWVGDTVRQRISASLFGAGVNGNRVRLSMQAGPFIPFTLGNVTVGLRGAGDFDFAEPPVTVTFNGAPGVTMPTGERLLSDPVPLLVDGSSDLVVAMHITGGDPGLSDNDFGGVFTRAWKSGGDDTNTLEAVGYDDSGGSRTFVSILDVCLERETSVVDWKIEHVSEFKPGATPVLYFVGVSR